MIECAESDRWHMHVRYEASNCCVSVEVFEDASHIVK